MGTSKRIDDSDLPHGGAYAILYFHDADGSPVAETEALKITAIEYTALDEPLVITFIDVNGDEYDNSTGTQSSSD